MTPLHQGRLWPCVQRRTNSASHQYKYSFLLYVCVCVCVSVCGCNESSATYLGRPLKKPHVHACTCSHQDPAVHIYLHAFMHVPLHARQKTDTMTTTCSYVGVNFCLGACNPAVPRKVILPAWIDRPHNSLLLACFVGMDAWKPTSRAADEQCKCEATSCLFH
jgi:hypothetical protein